MALITSGCALFTVWASKTGPMYLFGGMGAGNAALSDLWELFDGKWVEVVNHQVGGVMVPTAKPAARSGAVAWSSTDGGVGYVFGGQAAGGRIGMSDAWSVSAAGLWEPVPPQCPNCFYSDGTMPVIVPTRSDFPVGADGTINTDSTQGLESILKVSVSSRWPLGRAFATATVCGHAAGRVQDSPHTTGILFGGVVELDIQSAVSPERSSSRYLLSDAWLFQSGTGTNSEKGKSFGATNSVDPTGYLSRAGGAPDIIWTYLPGKASVSDGCKNADNELYCRHVNANGISALSETASIGEVSHGLQPHSLWRIPTAAVSQHVFGQRIGKDMEDAATSALSHTHTVSHGLPPLVALWPRARYRHAAWGDDDRHNLFIFGGVGVDVPADTAHRTLLLSDL